VGKIEKKLSAKKAKILDQDLNPMGDESKRGLSYLGSQMSSFSMQKN